MSNIKGISDNTNVSYYQASTNVKTISTWDKILISFGLKKISNDSPANFAILDIIKKNPTKSTNEEFSKSQEQYKIQLNLDKITNVTNVKNFNALAKSASTYITEALNLCGKIKNTTSDIKDINQLLAYEKTIEDMQREGLLNEADASQISDEISSTIKNELTKCSSLSNFKEKANKLDEFYKNAANILPKESKILENIKKFISDDINKSISLPQTIEDKINSLNLFSTNAKALPPDSFVRQSINSSIKTIISQIGDQISKSSLEDKIIYFNS